MFGVAPNKKTPLQLERSLFPKAIVRAILRDDRIFHKWEVASALAMIARDYRIDLRGVELLPPDDTENLLMKEETSLLREAGGNGLCVGLALAAHLNLRGIPPQARNLFWQYVGLLLSLRRRQAATVSK